MTLKPSSKAFPAALVDPRLRPLSCDKDGFLKRGNPADDWPVSDLLFRYKTAGIKLPKTKTSR